MGEAVMQDCSGATGVEAPAVRRGRAEAAPPKFYELSIEERIAFLAREVDAAPGELDALGRPDPLPLEVADTLVENVVGVMSLPIGIGRNFIVDGREVRVPMSIEEPSVVAATSFGAKLLAQGGGIRTSADPGHMVGQIFVTGVARPEDGAERLRAATAELFALADRRHPNLIRAGGGARGMEMRPLEQRNDGWVVVVELRIDVKDAMGANIVNSMCEAVAPGVAEALGGQVGMRILTNLCDRRLVRAEGRVPKEALGGAAAVEAIALASRFAELDPYRACTHNKGIMNGVDAVLVACGQDWRAAEAGAHAYASLSGRYRPLATWRVDDLGDLAGRLELPLAVGTVGCRARVHPSVCAAFRILSVDAAPELARIAAAVGLAQNLAALRALAHEGIIRGHMALHNRALAERR